MKQLGLTLGMAAILSGNVSTNTSQANPEKQKNVEVYLTEWNQDALQRLSKENSERISNLYLAFALVNSSGGIENKASINSFATRAKEAITKLKANTEITISIGGAGGNQRDKFNSSVENITSRVKLFDECLALLKHADKLDIDIEEWYIDKNATPQRIKQFVEFIRELQSKVKEKFSTKKEIIITLPPPINPSNFEKEPFYDLFVKLRTLGVRVNTMPYDGHYGNSLTDFASLKWFEATIKEMKKIGFADNKTGYGLPAYGVSKTGELSWSELENKFPGSLALPDGQQISKTGYMFDTQNLAIRKLMTVPKDAQVFFWGGEVDLIMNTIK